MKIFCFLKIFQHFKDDIYKIDHSEIIEFVKKNNLYLENNFLEKKHSDNFNSQLLDEK